VKEVGGIRNLVHMTNVRPVFCNQIAVVASDARSHSISTPGSVRVAVLVHLGLFVWQY
jgi:hypothetical protein